MDTIHIEKWKLVYPLSNEKEEPTKWIIEWVKIKFLELIK